jgi:cytochrome c oxidase assembly protein subunit 15
MAAGMAIDTGSSPSGPPPRLSGWVRLLVSHLVVALIALVGIGGATRVMQAGLACPDWPLCYGTLLPGRQMNLQVFLEWFHRLDAFLVGLALLVLAGVSVLQRQRLPRWLPWATGLALLLVAVQGGLGALTVLRLLAAPTVTAHLFTALLLVLLMAAIGEGLRAAGSSPEPASPAPAPPAYASAAVALPSWWLPLTVASGVLLLGQCVLGGLMASHWAASLCLEAGEGCRQLLRHRLGAWPAAAALLLQAIAALWLPRIHRPLARLALAPALLVPLQVLLGVLTLRLQLHQPLVTVAHQLLAALLVALVGAVWGRTLAYSLPARAVPVHHSLEMAHG